MVVPLTDPDNGAVADCSASKCNWPVSGFSRGLQNNEEAGRWSNYQHRQYCSPRSPRHSSSPYTTSKHAVWGLTQSLALEGRDHGIAVSALHPGNVMVERRGDGKSATGRDEGPEPLISTADMGKTALLMATLPPEANMLEAIVLPLGQAYLGRG